MTLFLLGLAVSMILTALGIYQSRRVAKVLLFVGAAIGLLVMVVGGTQWFSRESKTPIASDRSVKQSGQGNINVQGSQNTVTLAPAPPTPHNRPNLRQPRHSVGQSSSKPTCYVNVFRTWPSEQALAKCGYRKYFEALHPSSLPVPRSTSLRRFDISTQEARSKF